VTNSWTNQHADGVVGKVVSGAALQSAGCRRLTDTSYYFSHRAVGALVRLQVDLCHADPYDR